MAEQRSLKVYGMEHLSENLQKELKTVLDKADVEGVIVSIGQDPKEHRYP